MQRPTYSLHPSRPSQGPPCPWEPVLPNQDAPVGKPWEDHVWLPGHPSALLHRAVTSCSERQSHCIAVLLL